MQARWVVFFLLAASGTLLASPDAVNLGQPVGQITEPAPTFTWSEIPGASHYLLWVHGASKVALVRLVRASDASCVEGSCALRSPKSFREGRYRWWIRAIFPSRLGPWNGPREFRIGDVVARPGRPTPVAPSGVTEP